MRRIAISTVDVQSTVSLDQQGLVSRQLTNIKYIETINLIYRLKPVILNNEWNAKCIIYLPRLLQPPRFNSIASLYLCMTLHSPPLEDTPKLQEWKGIWKVVASMEGLVKFRVTFEPYYQFQDVWSEHELRL